MFLVSAFLGLLVAVILFVSVFRARHRGRLPPGPMGLPIVGSLFSMLKDPCGKLREFSDIYGPVYTLKIGPLSFIMLSDVDAIQQAFKKRSGEFDGRPRLMSEVTGMGDNGIVLLSPGSYHKYHKKNALSLLRELGVGTPRFEERILPHVTRLMREFGDTPRVLNVKNASSSLMSDIIGDITFGDSLYQGNNDTAAEVRELISENFSNNPVMLMLGKFLPVRAKQGLSQFVDMETNIARMLRLLGMMIRSHYDIGEEGEASQCFVAKYIREYARSHDGEAMRDNQEEEKQLGAMIIDFFQAGCETTENFFRWLLLLLAAHPEVQKRAQDEIEEVFAGGPPELKFKSKLPYVTAVLYETLRFRPPAPLGAPHCTTTNVEFQGYEIPADTPVMSDLLTAHFVEKDFPDPYKFKPERFLDENNQLTRLKDVLAFGAGPRVCVGEQLAKNIALISVMNVLYRYDLRSKDERDVDVSFTMGVNLVPRENCIKFVPRHPGNDD